MGKTATIKKYFKTFVTIKNDEETYFSIDYDLTITQEEKYNYTFLEGTLTIKYLDDERISNVWLIKADTFNQSCSFGNSIHIHDYYHSLGIGSFVLNEVLQLFNTYTPDASLKARLGIGDGGKENVVRRDTMYKNFGFEVHVDHIYIDKISNLILDRKFDYIQEVFFFKNYSKLLRENKQYLETNDSLNSSLKYYKDELKECRREKMKMKKWLFSLIACAIVLVIGVYIIL
jgi:hypothetical protein